MKQQSPLSKNSIQEGILKRGAVGAVKGAVGGALGGAAIGALKGGIPGAIVGAVPGAAVGAAAGGGVNAAVGKDEEESVEVVVNGKKLVVPRSHAEEMMKIYGEGVIGGTFKGIAKGAAGGAIGGGTLGAIGGALAGGLPGALAGAAGGALAGAIPGAAIGAPVGAITDKDENEEDACHKIVISGSDNDIQGAVQCTKHELDVLMNLVQNREKRRTKGDLLGKLQEDEEAKASLSPAQKKIAAMAPPHDKITGADFAAMKKVKENTNIKSFIKSLTQKNYAEANKYLKDIVDSKIKSKIESVRNEKIF